jgi:hypothetical protein
VSKEQNPSLISPYERETIDFPVGRRKRGRNNKIFVTSLFKVLMHYIDGEGKGGRETWLKQ